MHITVCVETKPGIMVAKGKATSTSTLKGECLKLEKSKHEHVLFWVWLNESKFEEESCGGYSPTPMIFWSIFKAFPVVF